MFPCSDALSLDTSSTPTDLSSWDILQDLEFLGDSGIDELMPAEPVRVETSSQERLKEKNRQAQKRTRQKKKERSELIEAQLAETTSQLHELKLRQKQLEARNQLLEKIAVLNKQQSAHFSGDLQYEHWVNLRDGALHALGLSGLARTQQGAVLLTTVHDPPLEMDLKTIGKMSLPEVAKLYTAYMHKATELLSENEDTGSSNPECAAKLQRCGAEIGAFLIVNVTDNPAARDKMHMLNMQDGTIYAEPPSEEALSELLAIIQYSQQQEEDILHLRRLFYSKLGQLARQRADLLGQLTQACSSENGKPTKFHLVDLNRTATATATTKELSDGLCANRVEESRTFMHVGMSLYHRIQTCTQLARAMAHQYPRIADIKGLMDLLAQQRGEPSVKTLMEPGGISDAQHCTNWNTVIQFVEEGLADGFHGMAASVAKPPSDA